MMRYLVPLIVFGALLALLAVGLNRDPRLVPSPLVGKPTPSFQLAELRDSGRKLTQDDLKGRVSLLNVWATWCVSCRAEHAVLMAIARRGDVPIYGLNYKDERQAALSWLDQLGDPYVANAYDPDGRLGLDLGVYGTPETFVLDQAGTIAYKHVGPITPTVWQETLSPLIQQLQQERG